MDCGVAERALHYNSGLVGVIVDKRNSKKKLALSLQKSGFIVSCVSHYFIHLKIVFLERINIYETHTPNEVNLTVEPTRLHSFTKTYSDQRQQNGQYKHCIMYFIMKRVVIYFSFMYNAM